jgi:hypothetical protein
LSAGEVVAHEKNEIDIDIRAVVHFRQHFGASRRAARADAKDAASLDVQGERHALQVLLKITEKELVSAADAMPADK